MIHALVAESCNAPGISTFQLAGALSSCVAFSARFLDGAPVFYLATDAASPPNYEAGIGTYHTTVPPTISRDTVTENNLGTTAKVNFSGTIQVINFIASDKTIYIDSVGNAHVTGNLVVATDAYITGQLRYTVNGSAITATDTGATVRTALIPLDSANNTDILVAGGASSPVGKFRVLNQLGTVELFSVDNSGNVTTKAGLTVGGSVVLNNNTAIAGKDTGGTPRNMIFVDSANYLDVQVPNAGTAFRVLNLAGSVALLIVDNAGNATVAGAGTVTGGMICNSTLFVQGASTLTGNVGCSGMLTTFGSSVSSNSGWEYGPAGGGAYSAARSFGIIVGSSVNVLANAYDAYSDSRLKTDIKAITPDMGMVFVLGAKPSTFIKAGFFEAGFIAQDMIRAGYEHLITHYDYPGLPELDEGDLVSKQDTAMSMIYDQTIAYLTAALQGMHSRVDALERKH